MPPWTPERAAQVSSLLQSSNPHRPVATPRGSRMRLDCTCGAEGLGWLPKRDCTARALKLLEQHRLEQS
jgi:hypothetical protein